MSPPVREGQSAAVHASPNAGRHGWPLRARVRRGLGIGVAAAIVLSFTGAFKTDQAALIPRFGYWLTLMLSGSLLGLLITDAVERWGRLARWRLLEMALAALLIALPLTFIVVVASAIAFDQNNINLDSLLGFFSIVFPVSLVMTFLNIKTAQPAPPPLPIQSRPPGSAIPSEPPVAAAADPPLTLPLTMPPALAERLPPRLRAGRLLALAAEDHYLRIHTDLGDDLVLMRMADAVALLSEVPGARVHRSWWVARAAVTGSRRDGDRLFLSLETGIDAPVSRSERAKLAASGWL